MISKGPVDVVDATLIDLSEATKVNGEVGSAVSVEVPLK